MPEGDPRLAVYKSNHSLVVSALLMSSSRQKEIVVLAKLGRMKLSRCTFRNTLFSFIIVNGFLETWQEKACT